MELSSPLRYEIELLVEYEDDLRAETEADATFDENASVCHARLESLINTYRPKETTRRSSNLRGPAATTTSKMKLPKMQQPSFTGSYTAIYQITVL